MKKVKRDLGALILFGIGCFFSVVVYSSKDNLNEATVGFLGMLFYNSVVYLFGDFILFLPVLAMFGGVCFVLHKRVLKVRHTFFIMVIGGMFLTQSLFAITETSNTGFIGESISTGFEKPFGKYGGFIFNLTFILMIFVMMFKNSIKKLLTKKKKEEVKITPVKKDVEKEKKVSPKVVKDVGEKSTELESMLKDHGIDAKITNTTIGATVTRLELSLAKGITVKKVTTLSDDIAMALKVENVRVELLGANKTIGIEYMNDKRGVVTFKTVAKSLDKKNALECVIGQDIYGENLKVDIAKSPHMLIAGATNSGKSVCVNSIISSIMMNQSPEDVKFLLIDPKIVELNIYNNSQHLLRPVITEVDEAKIALEDMTVEMDRRYQLLANEKSRNIVEYNKMADEKLPYIVIVIDEVADLMSMDKKDVEAHIVRLAQKARACGIHLILCTQRPTVDIINGTIKANIPTRISFALRTQVDSKTILDDVGAETLLGNGDGLLLESTSNKLIRFQGAYITDKEIKKIVKPL